MTNKIVLDKDNYACHDVFRRDYLDNIFEILMKEANKNVNVLDDEQSILGNIEKNELLLKKCLSKKEKKLLLRLMDNEGLLLEDTAIRNFTVGFKLGIKLGMELYKE